ncbi:hypothetical protein LTR85_009402 [Meristemomyces frigidus]|nr:hypothetical protein LTR85_009402 [Meristemomyces frigidus]
MAQTLDPKTDNPQMILCADGLAHPAANIAFDSLDPAGPIARVCAFLDPRTSWKMLTLGGILLHEYTHFESLVVPPLASEAVDVTPTFQFVYGPIQVQAIASQSFAPTIADSYAWFALESFWSATCGTTFGFSQTGDDQDQLCGNNACSEPSPDAPEAPTTGPLVTDPVA